MFESSIIGAYSDVCQYHWRIRKYCWWTIRGIRIRILDEVISG